MKKITSAFFSVCLVASAFGQNIIADVKVDYSQVTGSNTQAYQTLERSLVNYINATKWADVRLKTHERIEANFVLVISKKESNRYTASLQVQSRRPVFNSSYNTPVLNLNDKNFTFEYQEFEELIFNDRKFSGKNLTDVITYYIYVILGYDADTFQREGGTNYFTTAQKIANLGQSSRFSGWSEMDGMQSRTSLINNILKVDNKTLRNAYYQYHRLGLDVMSDNELRGKNAIGNALTSLEFYQQGNYTQFYPLDLFVTAKKDEISKVFGGGAMSSTNIDKVKEIFNSIAPANTQIWNNLKK